MTDDHKPDEHKLNEETPDSLFQSPSSQSQPGIIAEIWGFLRVRKKFWLAPIILALMLLGGLFMLAGSAGVLSPFIYAL